MKDAPNLNFVTLEVFLSLVLSLCTDSCILWQERCVYCFFPDQTEEL